MKKTVLTLIALSTVATSQAQIKNSDFENWTNLHAHVYETEMTDSHNVANPLHGDIDDWTYSFDVGISQTTDAYTGNYAVILHNWYNYAKTSLEIRDTVSGYPSEISGHFKYISDQFTSGTVNVIVLNTAGDTIVNVTDYLAGATEWTSFTTNLTPLVLPILPADSIFITFKNSNVSCQGNMMTCNLLYLDNLSLNVSTLTTDELDAFELTLFPNPTEGVLNIRFDEAVANNSAEVRIFDTAGKQVFQQNIVQSETILHLNHLSSGMYTAKINTASGKTTHHQILLK